MLAIARPEILPSPERDRVGYFHHDRFRGYLSVHFRSGLLSPCLRFAEPVTGRHARLGSRLPARLYRGRHLRRHGFMRFQGATRSSNRTCGFPASGFPTGFVVRHTVVIQRQNSEAPINRIMRKSSGSAVWCLMPPTEEVSNASADVVINRFVCPAACSVAEIGRPAAQ
jgi:hypothetical protein